VGPATSLTTRSGGGTGWTSTASGQAYTLLPS